LQLYLCTAYYITMIESYTIKWTTPHCVLTLRLIGLVWDVYDGRLKPVGLSDANVKYDIAIVLNII